MAAKELQFIQFINVDGQLEALFMAGPETPDNYQGLFDGVVLEVLEEADNHDDDDYNILDCIVEKLEELDIHRIYPHEVTTNKF